MVTRQAVRLLGMLTGKGNFIIRCFILQVSLYLTRFIFFIFVTYRGFGDPQSKNPRRSQRMVEGAVEMFVQMENWDGLAVIFTQLPSGRFA